MGFHNPDMSWSALERTLSGKEPLHQQIAVDAPSRMHKRPPIRLGRIPRPADAVPYAELHAHSSYSFLDGASSPEDLIAEAQRLRLTALAITDHDGFYGAAAFADAAEDGAHLIGLLREPERGYVGHHESDGQCAGEVADEHEPQRQDSDHQ